MKNLLNLSWSIQNRCLLSVQTLFGKIYKSFYKYSKFIFNHTFQLAYKDYQLIHHSFLSIYKN